MTTKKLDQTDLQHIAINDHLNLYYSNDHIQKPSRLIFTSLINAKLQEKLLDKIKHVKQHNIENPFFLGSCGRVLLVEFSNQTRILIGTDYFGLYSLFYTEDKNDLLIISVLDRPIIKRLGISIKSLKLLSPLNYISVDHSKKNRLKLSVRNKKRFQLSHTKDSPLVIAEKLRIFAEKSIISNLRILNTDSKQLEPVGVLFSGGIDSTTLCYVLKKYIIPFKAYVVGRIDSFDIQRAKVIAKRLDFPLDVVYIDSKIAKRFLPEIERIIQTRFFRKTIDTVPTPITLAIAITYYFGMLRMVMDGIKIVTTGVGTEELFAGFTHWAKDTSIQDLCQQKLFSINERDLYREQQLAAHFELKIVLPFLNLKLATYALKIPTSIKLKDGIKKSIWRTTAERIGVPRQFCYLKNRATQYGSAAQKILDKLAREEGFTQNYNKQDYVEFLYDSLLD